jgi:hypothetical protein
LVCLIQFEGLLNAINAKQGSMIDWFEALGHLGNLKNLGCRFFLDQLILE